MSAAQAWTLLVLGLLLASAPADATLPRAQVYTGEPSALTTESVTLNGSIDPVNEATSYYFEYGPTSAYGSQTPTGSAGSGTQSVHVSATLSGLSVATSYHFRLVAVNAGGTTDGQDRTFTTKKIPLSLTLDAQSSRDLFRAPFAVSGVVSGTGSASAELVLQANPFPYLAGFATVAGPEHADANGRFSFQLPGFSQTNQLRVSTLEVPPVNSRVAVALVAVRVTLHARSTGRQGYVRLFGTVTPSEPGSVVGFQLVRSRHRPRGVSTTLATGANGGQSRFSQVVHIPRTGRYRAFVYVASGAQVSNASRAILVD